MTWVLFPIVAAFVGYELVAHYVKHNQGTETLSHLIMGMERRFGLPARVLVACAVAALGVHLEGGF